MDRIIKMLPVKLSKDEWDERARQSAQLTDEIAEAERRVDAEKEAAKSRVSDAVAVVEGLQAKQRGLARVIREGQETREVPCDVTLDRRKMQRITTRVDTKVVVDTTPLSSLDARDGADWIPNFEKDQSELIHPEEPGVILETRPLTDADRQMRLDGDAPNGDGKKKSKRKGADASPI